MTANRNPRRIAPQLLACCALATLFCALVAAFRAHPVAGQQAASMAPPMAAPMKMAGSGLPAPGVYTIDPAHTFAYFGARHHVVGLVRGRFDKVTGTLTAGPDPAACAVDIQIDVSTIDTQIAKRDEDLRGDAYFDVAKFPTMTYQGHGIHHLSGSKWMMDGTLTMHGVTKTVPLMFTFNGVFSDTKPGEPIRAAFHATAALKRAEFSLGARDNLDELGTLQSPDVMIEIDVEADSAMPAH